MKVKLECLHALGCEREMIVDSKTPIVYRDLAGRNRRGSWRRWLNLRCNSCDCPAQAIIHEDDLVDAAMEKLGR